MRPFLHFWPELGLYWPGFGRSDLLNDLSGRNTIKLRRRRRSENNRNVVVVVVAQKTQTTLKKPTILDKNVPVTLQHCFLGGRGKYLDYTGLWSEVF